MDENQVEQHNEGIRDTFVKLIAVIILLCMLAAYVYPNLESSKTEGNSTVEGYEDVKVYNL